MTIIFDGLENKFDMTFSRGWYPFLICTISKLYDQLVYNIYRKRNLKKSKILW